MGKTSNPMNAIRNSLKKMIIQKQQNKKLNNKTNVVSDMTMTKSMSDQHGKMHTVSYSKKVFKKSGRYFKIVKHNNHVQKFVLFNNMWVPIKN